MKFCRTCKEHKTESEFHIRRASIDGLSPKCKSCASAYDKARASLPHRVEARKSYSKSQDGILRGNTAKRKYIKTNILRKKAHQCVSNAIRDKKIFRSPCEVCGSFEKIHAHHDDYAKPLDIRWLCIKHHREWHSVNGKAKNS